MRDSWNKAIGYILDDEGAEFNVSPTEPGGASKYGVSRSVLSEWNLAHGKLPASIADVGDVTTDLASQIYREKFADAIGFDTLPVGVDYRLLDIAVNLGVNGAKCLLDAVLGNYTGTPNPEIHSPSTTISDLSVGWIAIKSRSDNWHKFAHGWMNRNNRAISRALQMIGS